MQIYKKNCLLKMKGIAKFCHRGNTPHFLSAHPPNENSSVRCLPEKTFHAVLLCTVICGILASEAGTVG